TDRDVSNTLSAESGTPTVTPAAGIPNTATMGTLTLSTTNGQLFLRNSGEQHVDLSLNRVHITPGVSQPLDSTISNNLTSYTQVAGRFQFIAAPPGTFPFAPQNPLGVTTTIDIPKNDFLLAANPIPTQFPTAGEAAQRAMSKSGPELPLVRAMSSVQGILG